MNIEYHSPRAAWVCRQSFPKRGRYRGPFFPQKPVRRGAWAQRGLERTCRAQAHRKLRPHPYVPRPATRNTLGRRYTQFLLCTRIERPSACVGCCGSPSCLTASTSRLAPKSTSSFSTGAQRFKCTFRHHYDIFGCFRCVVPVSL